MIVAMSKLTIKNDISETLDKWMLVSLPIE